MTTATAVKTGSKKDRIIYWIATGIVVLFDGVGAIWFNSDLAKEGTRHLGFPDYFRVELGIAKIIGAILLLLPMVPKRVKEWVYVGFGISTLSAAIANGIVDGPVMAIFPLVFFAILLVSYIYYHKITD